MAARCTQASHALMRIPILNFFWDIWFHGQMDKETLKDFLNVQGLMSALLLASVCSYPGSVEHDELQEAGARLGKCWYANADEDSFWRQGGGPEHVAIFIFQWRMLMAMIFLTSNVLSVCLVYMSFTGLDLNVDKEGKMTDEALTKYKEWFRYVRYLFIAMTGSLYAGIVYFFQSTYDLVLIKFPVPAQYQTCAEEERGNTPYAFVQQMCAVAAGIATLGPLMLLSFVHFKQMVQDDVPDGQDVTSDRSDCSPATSSNVQGRNSRIVPESK
eukprot:TRINITY_DN6724_c0_g1_i1.p1 TRINITY_DN6724_c0_g1~~TRINITY_DN6724_c0_g1_i1.p1  ORF type:complete len:271 (+),score=24.37 TRINITY_DN6724_c0_g1_i1:78-890(+)